MKNKQFIFSGEKYADYAAFWRQELSALEEPFQFRGDVVRSVKAGEQSLTVELPESARAILWKYSEQRPMENFVLWLTALQGVLSRYSDRKDLALWTPQLKKERTTQQWMEGVLLRLDLSGVPNWKSLVLNTAQRIKKFYRYQNYPLDLLGSELWPENGTNTFSPVWVEYEGLHQELPEIAQEGLQIRISKANAEKGTFEIICRRENYSVAFVQQFANHLITAIEQLAQLDQSLNDFAMVSTTEREEILAAAQSSTPKNPIEESVVDLFVKTAQSQPEQIAALYDGKSWTYADLDHRSNQLAEYLRQAGLPTGALVGLCMDRSLEMLGSIMALFKCGAAYVPMDPDYPDERISYIVEDTEMKWVLAMENSSAKFTAFEQVQVIALDKEATAINELAGVPTKEKHSLEQLAYMIYTSGSTGRPKGVMINHRNLVERLAGMVEWYSINNDTRTFQLTNFVFDVSLLELVLPLIAGGSVAIPTKAEIYDLDACIEFCIELGVTKIQATPSYLTNWIRMIDTEKANRLSLEIICSGGESLKKELAEKIQERLPTIRLYNHYGPTETTVDALGLDKLDHYYTNNIGQPLPPSKVYIVDSQLRLVPIGVAGEILIGGACVSPGYWNRAALNAERFVSNPFDSEDPMPLYRTGDLGRWSSDWEVEFMGRVDEQVKIRGFRVELGEVESVLNSAEQVTDCAVLARPDQLGALRLIAYVVPQGNFDRKALQDHLKEKLPYYMVPADWVALREMPLTITGKINKKALPDPENSEVSRTEFEAPNGATETELAQLWEEFFPGLQIGRRDNFFERGGHSLMVMSMIAKIHQQFGVKVSLPEVFEFPELMNLAAVIAEKNEFHYGSIPTVEPVLGQNKFHLSDAQRQIWVLEQQQERPVGFILPDYFKLHGTLHREYFIQAFQQIVRRHESLRTRIIEFKNEPYQEVVPYAELPEYLFFEDLQSRGDIETYVAELAEADLQTPFDLEVGPLLRMRLLQTAPEEHVFLLTIHHIVTDGISTLNLFKELIEGYNALVQGNSYLAPKLSVQYKDYSAWQLQKATDSSHREYWLTEFGDYTPTQLLAPDFERKEPRSHQGEMVSMQIPMAQTEQVLDFCRRKGLSTFMFFSGLLHFLLYRYSGQEDISVGSPVSERDHPDLEAQIGIFVNLLALKSRVNAEMNFGELFEQIKDKTLQAYEHQSFSFGDLVKDLKISQSSDRNPLFDVYMSVGVETMEQLGLENFEGIELEKYGIETIKCIHDLVLNFVETPAGFQGSLVYSPTLFRRERIELMRGHLEALIEQLLVDEEKLLASSVAEIDFMGSEEKQQLLDMARRKVDFPEHLTVVDLFEKQVKARPDHTALTFEDESLSYTEFNERTNQLARFILARGIAPEQFVALCLDRSMDMIIAIWGIIKAGAAYVPIDPQYPQQRIDYMLADSNYQLLIDADLMKDFYQTRSLYLADDLKQKPQPEQLYSMIYTSGSTGKPKGVMLEHRGLVNHISNVRDHYAVDRDSRFLQFFNIGFDAAAEEIFTSLCSGASLHIRSEEDLDGTRMIELINRHRISHADFSSAYFEGLITSLPPEAIQHQLTSCGVGGEKINLKFVAKNRAKLEAFTRRLFNVYGPTETTLTVSIFSILEDEQFDARTNIPIGKPYPNREIYICDTQGQPVPVGVFGEVQIGGVGVARGYYERPELTTKKFTSNPFQEGQHSRMYHTGDLARWLPDGNIEFLGRKDDQVKIRGYRVELGEIESLLQGSQWVEQCVVIARQEPEQPKRLVAYIVPDGKFNRKAIQSYLQKSLPGYMVPSMLVELSDIPLTGNGKVDKRALPVPNSSDLIENEYVRASSEIEKVLVATWKELLGAKRVGITDNFYELGGDSIKALQVSARLHKAGFKIAVKDILLYQNISAIIANMDEEIRIADQSPVTGEVPFNGIQKAFFNWDLAQAHHFNQAVLVTCPSDLQPKHLENMLKQIQDHHDMLRAYIIDGPDGPTQYCAPPGVPVPLQWVDLRTEARPEQAISMLANEIQGGLRLDRQLWSVVYFQRADSAQLLFILHHLIVDGLTWRILLEDLSTLYYQQQKGEKYDLYLKTDSFKVWTEHLEEYAASESLQSEVPYWNEIEEQYWENLPRDMEPPRNYCADEKRQDFCLSPDYTEQLLGGINKAYQVEINAFLLAAFAKAWYECFAQSEQVVMMEGHGREDLFDDVGVSRTIGWFTSFYPFAMAYDPAADWESNLQNVQSRLNEIPNKGMGYGLLKHLSPEANLDSSWKPSISFNYLGQLQSDGAQYAFKLADESVGEVIGPLNERLYDLDVSGLVVDGQLRMGIVFNPQQFKESTIQVLLETYQEALEQGIDRAVLVEVKEAPSFTTKNIPQANLQKLNQLFE